MDVARPTSAQFPWRLFWLLLVAAILSVLAIAPIASEMVGAALAKLGPPPISLPLVILLGAVQNLAILALVVWLGIKLSRSLDLKTPILESWVYGQGEVKVGPTLRSGLITGTVVGAIVLGSMLILVPRLPNLPFVVIARLPLWKRFLVCFYGGVYEEVLTRLFLMSLLAWIANRSWRQPAANLSGAAFWFANITAALIFGLGHLPSVSLFMAITPLVVVAALVLNGLAGIAFGYLFRKHGLESAIVAHFTTDFVVFVAGASLLRT